MGFLLINSSTTLGNNPKERLWDKSKKERDPTRHIKPILIH